MSDDEREHDDDHMDIDLIPQNVSVFTLWAQR